MDINPKEQAFFEAIDATWYRLAKRPLINPIDWAHVAAWYFGSIPVEVVICALEECFRRFKPKHQGDRIRSIAYISDEVLRQADIHLDLVIDKYWKSES